MKKRIAFVLVSIFLALGLLSAVVLAEISEPLPQEGQQLLDTYLLKHYPEGAVTMVQYAKDRERFTADLAHPIIQPSASEYRPSPTLYDGEIILPPERSWQFPFPAQEVWCVTVSSNSQPPEYLFLARHETLYDENWVLYESSAGRQNQVSIGCRN